MTHVDKNYFDQKHLGNPLLQ